MVTEHRIQMTGPELDERLAQVLTNEEDIGQEQQTRETTDEGMQEQLDALSTRMDAQDTTNEQVASDIEGLQQAVGTGGSVDDKIAAAVGAEATAREAADTALGGRITAIEAAVGTGGSVDERIATEATARANADTALGNRMTTLEGSVGDRLDQQDAAIGLLDGHKLEVVDVLPTDASPAVTPESDVIYRLVVTDSETGDVSYEDYMYNEDDLTTPKKIANYPLPGIDEEPTAGSKNLVKSGGVANLSEINVNYTEMKFVDTTGTIKTTPSNMYKLTDELYVIPGIKLFRAKGAGTSGCVVAFYDRNHNFISYIGTGSTSLTDITLSEENIPATAVYFRANMAKATGRVFSIYRINVKPYIKEISDRIDKENNSLFYLRGFSTYKDGRLVGSNQIFYCTPYVDIDDITDGTQISCLFSANVGIQCFDSDRQFIGTYNDFSDISESTNIIFSFDSNKLQQNTKYIRLCCSYNRGYINSLSYSGKYSEQVDNEYAIAVEDISTVLRKENISHVLRNIKQLIINADYYDYDAVYIVRIPSYLEFKNQNTTDYFIFDFYKNNNLERIYLKIKDGVISGDSIFFNTGSIVFCYDYSQIHHGNFFASGHNLAKLTIKAFTYSFPQPQPIGKKYVNSTKWPDIADSFTSVQYKTDNVLDVTCQRFPATTDALTEDSEEFFCFYVWDGESVVKKIFCHISDGQVEGSVITYNSDILSFVVDYSIAGTVTRKASTSRQDLTFASAAFVIVKPEEDTHIRKDIVNKKYANMSSSTFTSAMNPSQFASKRWHKELIEDLGMEYSDYGMGGTRYRCYASTKFSLDYQKSDQTLYPTVDRVMLNQVAKICTDAANGGYYPDMITSCCVLNDCYNAADLINKIGTAEEAFAQTLPDIDLSTAATIERDFTAFYESTDPDIVAFKGKSCNCMRLVYELLSRRFPKAQIIIWSCQQVTNSTMNQDAITHFNEEQKKIAKKLAIQYVDLNAECGINQITASTFLRDDGLHPNIDGQTVYYNYVKEKLNNIIALKKELSR